MSSLDLVEPTKLTIVAAVNDVVQLTCASNNANPLPVFSWWIADPANMDAKANVTEYSSDWKNGTGSDIIRHSTLLLPVKKEYNGWKIWCEASQVKRGIHLVSALVAVITALCKLTCLQI